MDIFNKPLIPNLFVSAAVGAVVISIASGMLFYVDSSSGGTDVVALIVKKFSGINIGKATLVADILIVIIGGGLSGIMIFAGSFMALIIKTFGIDFVISVIKKKM